MDLVSLLVISLRDMIPVYSFNKYNDGMIEVKYGPDILGYICIRDCIEYYPTIIRNTSTCNLNDSLKQYLRSIYHSIEIREP